MIRRAAAVVFSYYPADPRVRRETEALAEAGVPVDVICLQGEGEAPVQTYGDITVHRMPLRKKRGGKLRYLWEYFLFFLMALVAVTRLHLKNRYRLVHVHNMPDFLVFTALLPRLTGTKVVLDLHDPMPEVFMAKYRVPASHPSIKLIAVQERLSISFAHLVITPNVAFRECFAKRGTPREKIEVVMNSPQESIFNRSAQVRGEPKSKEEFRVMYHGTVVERHGLETALRAVKRLESLVPDLSFHVYGDGDFVPRFLELVMELKLEDRVVYHGHVPMERIAEAIPAASVGLIPNKKTPFTEINLPTRIFEYLSMGKPVIAPRTRGILDYFDEGSLHFFEAGNLESLAETILKVHTDPALRELVLRRGLEIYAKHTWREERRKFLAAVETLLAGTPRAERHRKAEDPERAEARVSV